MTFLLLGEQLNVVNLTKERFSFLYEELNEFFLFLLQLDFVSKYFLDFILLFDFLRVVLVGSNFFKGFFAKTALLTLYILLFYFLWLVSVCNNFLKGLRSIPSHFLYSPYQVNDNFWNCSSGLVLFCFSSSIFVYDQIQLRSLQIRLLFMHSCSCDLSLV